MAALKISTGLGNGDPTEAGERRYYGTVDVGDVTVTVYESRETPGLVIVDIDAPDDGRRVAVTVNDGYVFDGSGTKAASDG